MQTAIERAMKLKQTPHTKNKGNLETIRKAHAAMNVWAETRKRLEKEMEQRAPEVILPWNRDHHIMMKNTAKSLYLQARLHSLDDTVVLSFGGEESFYGITRIHVPSSKVAAFNKGVIPSASMAPAPEKYRLKQIWETAGFNEIVNDDCSITYTFTTDLFVKKRLQRMHKQSPETVVDRMAIDFLVN